MKFYVDNKGFMHASVPTNLKLLGSFLEEDVQNSSTWCVELLNIIQEIETGKLESWEGTGNAHTLCITANGATITNEYTEEVLPGIDIYMLKDALLEWKKIIDN